MANAYRYTLDGNGPYQSEEFDTEAAAEEAADARQHVVTEFLILNADGTATSTKRELIDLDASAPVDPQPQTDGTQPA